MVGEESLSGCWANSSVEMAREEGLDSGRTSEGVFGGSGEGSLIGCGEGSVVGGFGDWDLYLYLFGKDLF